MFFFPVNPKFLPNRLISYFNCNAKPPWQYSHFKYWGFPLERKKDGPLDFPLLYNVGEIIKSNIYNIDNEFKMEITDLKLVLLVTYSKKILKVDPNTPKYIKNFPILGGAVYYVKNNVVYILYMTSHPLIKGGGTILLDYFMKKYNVITLDTLKESEVFYLKNGFRKNKKNKEYKELIWRRILTRTTMT